MYEYCTGGIMTVCGSYHHYIALCYSWVQTQFVGMGIYMSFYHVVLSSLLSYKEHMYCICYFIKLYNYVSVPLNLIQSNMLKENYRSQIISLNKLLEQESILAGFNTTAWQFAEGVESGS